MQYPNQKRSPQTHGLTLFFFYFCSASFPYTGEDISFLTLSFKINSKSEYLSWTSFNEFSTLTAQLFSQLGFQEYILTQTRRWWRDYTSPSFVFLPASSEYKVHLLKGCIYSGIPAHKPQQTILSSPKLKAHFWEAYNQSFRGGIG